MPGSIPDKFKGVGVDKPENWNKPSVVEYEPKKVLPEDVVIKIETCGVCASDLHTVKGDWGDLQRKDLVAGHEIVGEVVMVGDKVKNVKVGDRAGIGAMSNSCLDCNRCASNNPQYCKEKIDTYNAPDKKSGGYITQGGYASHAISHEHFVFPVPEEITSAEASPLLCAGLTVYSPLVRNLGKDATGKTVGIVGIGGLGHLAVQFAKALGAEVIAFSRGTSKKEDALKLGASSFISTKETPDFDKDHYDGFDFILNCAANFSQLELKPFLASLKVGASFVSVGLPPVDEKVEIQPFDMATNEAKVGQSLLGGREEALAMLKLAAEKDVRPWIEKIPISKEGVATALEKLDQGDVRYRSVLVDFDKL
ncbi:NADP-dependent alcohol dehydrogenase 7 [[Candida] anglica]|uniref:NADP-dependent alcohol dehydrogenase 7 n=1 Tax=[Candida] anglica TaxID=148631 RepID=A0ABP0EB79_9ASCO